MCLSQEEETERSQYLNWKVVDGNVWTRIFDIPFWHNDVEVLLPRALRRYAEVSDVFASMSAQYGTNEEWTCVTGDVPITPGIPLAFATTWNTRTCRVSVHRCRPEKDRCGGTHALGGFSDNKDTLLIFNEVHVEPGQMLVIDAIHCEKAIVIHRNELPSFKNRPT